MVQKETSYFEIDGKRSSRKQSPLQNAFSLTVHKTQVLTLPHVIVFIDENIFAEGQVYVALSRASSLENLRVLKFDFSQIKCSNSVLLEYERLDRVKVICDFWNSMLFDKKSKKIRFYLYVFDLIK